MMGRTSSWATLRGAERHLNLRKSLGKCGSVSREVPLKEENNTAVMRHHKLAFQHGHKA